MKILVSACLLGVVCRWHGRKAPYSSYLKRLENNHPNVILIGICPETLGGLPTPRPPVKRRKGIVYETCPDKANRKNVTGKDVTNFFVCGAEKTLEIAKKHKIKKAVLCKWSPSCDINGITGRLLSRNGIDVVNSW